MTTSVWSLAERVDIRFKSLSSFTGSLSTSTLLRTNKFVDGKLMVAAVCCSLVSLFKGLFVRVSYVRITLVLHYCEGGCKGDDLYGNLCMNHRTIAGSLWMK